MYTFNQNQLQFGKTIEQPDQKLIRNTLGLVNASLDDALKYGGEITREAIGAMNLQHDRKNIIVDVKVHMLMPGFYAAIPGWHADGVPRGDDFNPLQKARPRMDIQKRISDEYSYGDQGQNMRPTRYHMIVTGEGCLTEFIGQPVKLTHLRDDNLYSDMNREINARIWLRKISVPSCTVTEFDWWDIHRGVAATKHEWRYFIRVAEIDIAEPERDLRNAIRTQHQVYAPENFGW